MLQLDRFSRTFENGSGVKEATFTVHKGEIIGLIGKCGCGKSTLLRSIAGLDTRFQGELLIEGKPMRGPHPEIGVVFQEALLMPWLTVIQNVAFGLKGTKAEKEKIARTYLQKVGLEGTEHLYVRQLSGGMAQRVSIARALAPQPKLLLMDEPFSALDAFTKMQLQDLILDIWKKEQLTVLMVTHDIDEALYLCDRIVLLAGKPSTVKMIFEVPEERPRGRGSVALAKMKTEILKHLELESVHV